ncbi:helix-turn-helix domain-containing protein [Subdoligranulum variabile]|uniref:DNA-binding helix-turn-helix protein n=1 Tax=Subdoligranulum variabile DSM 15176 TaxID=411471 RepID=D1PIW7_9FIRM|nr:helix-turn-helix transcriptional regulator [Subdoligranulum variabile]EFB77476.1 DNA-binding helix-turn-helix protein [Subdoligranulum variabile DSM 15176]
MTLGENIQAARKKKGLSQEALAEQVGVSRQALGKWEKDTALPSLDNLQALAAALDVSVDGLLGTARPGGTPEPSLTLDTLRALLEARDAEKRRRTRLWGGAALAVAALLLCGIFGVAWQYDRQVQALKENYAQAQQQFSATQSELSAQIEELQAAIRQGEATVLDWSWQPNGKVVHDLDWSWVPVSVSVTPRTATEGMTGQLVVVHQGGRYDGTTELMAMSLGADGVYRVERGLIFTVGETVDLSVQWQSTGGTTTNEPLGTVVCTEYTLGPEFLWDGYGTDFDYGYRTRMEVGRTMLTLTNYSVQMDLDCPAWMQIQSVTVELRLKGAAGEPAAEIELTCDDSWQSDTRNLSQWSGTFWNEEVKDGWPYEDGDVRFVAQVTDKNGNVWTDIHPLSEKP